MSLITEAKIMKLKQFLGEASKIAILVHQHPDGDALGSATALALHILSTYGELARLKINQGQNDGGINSRASAISDENCTTPTLNSKEVLILVPDKYPDSLQFILDNCGINAYRKEREEAENIVHKHSTICTRVNTEEPKHHCSMVIASEEPERAAEFLRDCELICCLDFNSPSRIGGLSAALTSSRARKVLIDHHIDPDESAFDLCFSDPSSSSTCELLYWVLKSLIAGTCTPTETTLPQSIECNKPTKSTLAQSIEDHQSTETVQTQSSKCEENELAQSLNASRKIHTELAYALTTGMTTDTNNFANSVTPSTLRMAAEVLELGVDRNSILDKLYHEYREQRLRLMGHFLLNLMTLCNDSVAYAIIDSETAQRFDLQDGETEGFVNMPLAINDVKYSIFLKEDAGHFRVSIRSKQGYSAARMAREYFHGGGHENAAGGRLYFPEDIATSADASKYIEEISARFVQNEAEEVSHPKVRL